MARDLFAHQLQWNRAYAQFAQAAGWSAGRLPARWDEIPAVPSSAFKESVLATFDPSDASIAFETSGTTRGAGGHHYFEPSSLRLYDAALLAGFDRFLLDGNSRARYRYFLLVPERETSSLGYMMRRVAERRGDGKGGSYLDAAGNDLDVERLERDAALAAKSGTPACIAGTAFAFVALLEALAGRHIPTAPGSKIMETGGFKGRSREIPRNELYLDLSRTFGIEPSHIVAEYGMTELTSQYYDAPASRVLEQRRKTGPPWLRAVVVGSDGREVAIGETGILRHVDLANRGSVVAIETEDLALRCPDGAFVLLGRDARASLRGCSLDAEDILARRP